MHNQGMVDGPALRGEDTPNGVFVRGIASESVDRFSGDANQTSSTQYCDCVTDGIG